MPKSIYADNLNRSTKMRKTLQLHYVFKYINQTPVLYWFIMYSAIAFLCLLKHVNLKTFLHKWKCFNEKWAKWKTGKFKHIIRTKRKKYTQKPAHTHTKEKQINKWTKKKREEYLRTLQIPGNMMKLNKN